eukprot:2070788-Prymnesium_polylepis.3
MRRPRRQGSAAARRLPLDQLLVEVGDDASCRRRDPRAGPKDGRDTALVQEVIIDHGDDATTNDHRVVPLPAQLVDQLRDERLVPRRL